MPAGSGTRGAAERGADVIEKARQRAAEEGGGSNDADGDEGGNQAVLDRGRAGLVVRKLRDSVHLLLQVYRHPVDGLARCQRSNLGMEATGQSLKMR